MWGLCGRPEYAASYRRYRVADTHTSPQYWVVSVSTKRAVFPENVSVELVVLNVPHSSELPLGTLPPPVAVTNPVALIVPVTAGSWSVSPRNVISNVMVSCDPTCTTDIRIDPVSCSLSSDDVAVAEPEYVPATFGILAGVGVGVGVGVGAVGDKLPSPHAAVTHRARTKHTKRMVTTSPSPTEIGHRVGVVTHRFAHVLDVNEFPAYSPPSGECSIQRATRCRPAREPACDGERVNKRARKHKRRRGGRVARSSWALPEPPLFGGGCGSMARLPFVAPGGSWAACRGQKAASSRSGALPTRSSARIDLNTLRAMKRSPLGLDLYLWLTYRTFGLKRPLRLTWPLLYRQFGVDPARSNDKFTVRDFRSDCLRELKKIKNAWPDLHYRTVKGALVLSPSPSAIAPSQLRLVE